MSEWSADALTRIYFLIAGSVMFLLAWNGWRQGVARQIVTLVAIASAYAIGWFGGGSAAPLFEFLHFPAPITRIIAGVAAGFVAFVVIRMVGCFFFKRTAQQQTGRARLSYGLLGALMGMLFGSVLIFVVTNVILMIGAIAKASVDSFPQESDAQKPGALVSGLAKLGGALDSSSTGQFLHEHDPLATQHTFGLLTKLGIMVSRTGATERFIKYPGIEQISKHPKLMELRTDASLAELLESGNYWQLLRHEKIVALANDPDFSAEIRKIELEKALDFALRSQETGERP